MPYFSIAIRSMPMPKAKPCHWSGSMPAGLQHVGVHHAGAEDLHPVVALADLQLPAFPRTAQIDLGRRFGEREMRGAEPQFHLVDLEKARQNSSSTHFRFAIDRSLSIASPSTWWNIGVWVWS